LAYKYTPLKKDPALTKLPGKILKLKNSEKSKETFPDVLWAINKTLEVHPGYLIAHQNKIAISIMNSRTIIWLKHHTGI
jgi:hypothetical protein